MLILYAITVLTFARMDTMDHSLDNVRDWCEQGHHITVVIDTYDTQIDRHRLQQFENRIACTKSKVHIEVHQHKNDNKNPNIKYNHLKLHRKHFHQHINNYDLFVYADDDISIRSSTLQRWLYEMHLIDKELWKKYYVGLIYYENSLVMLRNKKVKQKQMTMRPDFVFNSPDGMSYLRNRVTWNIEPSDVYLMSSKNMSSHWTVGIPDNHFITTDVTAYSASYILHRTQLQHLEMSCSFLTGIVGENPDLFAEMLEGQQLSLCQIEGRIATFPSSTIDDPIMNCCMRWLMPVDTTSFDSLLIHHIGTPGQSAENKWINRHRIPRAHFIDQWHDRLEQLATVTKTNG